MIKPVQQDDALLVDIAASRDDTTGALRLWWLGQSGFLLQHRGAHLLIDPYLSDSLTRKYADTPKPHVRLTERVVAPDRLGFIDLITSSHNHTDHLDGETLSAIAAARPNVPLAMPEANVEFARARLGQTPLRLEPVSTAQPRRIGGVTLHAIPAAHDRLETDAQGRPLFVGYVINIGPWTVYHSGDTVVYDGLADALRPHRIDIAILPINGQVGNMGGADAARLAHDIGAKLVIPCHFEMFEFNTADPRDAFIPACERLGQRYRVMRAGERLTLIPGDL